MKKYRFFALVLVLVFSLTALSGCGQKKDSVYFLNFKPEVAEVYNDIARAYERETGINLRVVTASSGTYEQTLKSEIGKSDSPSIFIVNGPVGYASWKDYCADLSNTELYAHLTDKSLAISDGGKVYGIPAVVEGYGIIYNEELTDKYFALNNRQTQINSMDEVKSFDALKAVVEDMSSHKSELGIDGVFASSSLKSGEDWRWHTHLANVAVYYEFEENEIDPSKKEDTAEIEFSYSDNFKSLFDLYINNSTTDKKLLGSKQVADSMAEFALGRCIMVQNGNWAWSQINGISGNTVKEEDIKFLPLYMGVEGENSQGLCIGTENYLCINSKQSEEKQKMAADFLYWLYSSETGKEFVTKKLNFISPFDTFEDDELPNDPLAKEVFRWMSDEDVVTVPWNFTVFPSLNFKNNFGSALLQYAQGTLSWDGVKDAVVNSWREEAGQ